MTDPRVVEALREFAARGGRSAAKKRTKAQRVALARKAARARWSKRGK